MTSVERAKRFIQNKSSAIAFTVVPLASLIAIAPAAKATTVFNTTGTCSVVQSVGVGLTETLSEQSCNVATLTGNSVTGISISGFAKATVDTGGTQSFGVQFIAADSISAGEAVDVPLSWDFTDELLAGAAANLSYDLEVMINGSTLFSKTGAPSGGTITGSHTLTLPADATSYSISLLIDGTAAGPGSALTATIPSGSSIDLQAQNASTPEPSTFALAASALSGLLWWRRRKA